MISILMILAAAAANVMRPALDGRRIREAARAVNVYLSSARNRAMETGRPCGVMLRRFGGTPAVMNLDQCEVPPCYAGDTEQSLATVTCNGTTITATLCSADSPDNLLRFGDFIQFNCQGPCYPITTPSPGGFITSSGANWVLTCDTGGQLVPWPASWPPSSPGVPYRIYRTPVKGAAAPLQLPASSVIDLDFSGTDLVTFGSVQDVMILFAPN
ncbi:MAG: hypothetical protein NTY65_05575, partial [Planctomycetota bacterium]|nr:hypothetical protein [Planctomycetota bacterium]